MQHIITYPDCPRCRKEMVPCERVELLKPRRFLWTCRSCGAASPEETNPEDALKTALEWETTIRSMEG